MQSIAPSPLSHQIFHCRHIPTTTASAKSGTLTATTKYRYGALQEPHADYAKTTKGYFTNRSAQTKVNLLTNGQHYPSLSFIIGSSPLRRALRTQFASVNAVLEDEADPTATGTDVLLGSASNRVDRLVEAFVEAEGVGKCHAILLCVDDAPKDRRDDFPHGPEFKGADAPLLKPFFAANAKNKKHVVALPPICHPNNWGVDDVDNGKINESTEQAFADAHGERGGYWLSVSKMWDEDVMKTILANKAALNNVLPAIADKRMFNGRLTLQMVTPENEDRLTAGKAALEERIDGVVAKKKAATVPGEIAIPDAESLLVTPDLPAAAGGKQAAEKTNDTSTLRAKHMLMWAHLGEDKHAHPPVFHEGGELLIDTPTRQEQNRAYAQAAIDAVAVSEPDRCRPNTQPSHQTFPPFPSPHRTQQSRKIPTTWVVGRGKPTAGTRTTWRQVRRTLFALPISPHTTGPPPVACGGGRGSS